MFFLSFLVWGETECTWYIGHYLANCTSALYDGCVGVSHMSDNRQMSVAMQRLVDSISIVTNSTLLRNNTVTLY
jgi:hypothetical protein